MATTNFTTGTVITSEFLNDVQDAAYLSYTPSAAGAVTTTVRASLDERVSPAQFGAIGNGVTDDLAALKLALESGFPVDGCGLTYAISGTCAPTSFKGLFNANLVQIGDNTTVNVRTLSIVGISDFFIENVHINMGSNVTTLFSDSGNSGLYVGGTNETTFCYNFNIRGVYVTGNGCGAGIQIRHAKRFSVDGCVIHDRVSGSSPDPTNDSQGGVQIVNCANFTLSNTNVYNLKTRLGGVDLVKWTRGFLFSEIRDCSIIGCSSTSTDQGYDFSGGYVASPLYIGNRRFVISGCTANNNGTFGFKFANVAKDGLVANCQANNVGSVGFVFSPSAVSITGVEHYNTQNIDVVGCKVVNALGTGSFGTNATGFRVAAGSIYTTYPRSIRLKNCSVIDTQDTPTTTKAYASDVDLSSLVGQDIANTTTNCTHSSNIPAAYTSSIGPTLCLVTGSSDQSITNATWTDIVWNVDLSDPNDMHSSTVDNENIYVRTSGWYEVKAQVSFDPVAAGKYLCKLLKNNTTIDRTTVTEQAPTTAGPATLITSIIVYAVTGDYFSSQVYQNTGGAVDLNVNESHFSVKLIS